MSIAFRLRDIVTYMWQFKQVIMTLKTLRYGRTPSCVS